MPGSPLQSAQSPARTPGERTLLSRLGRSWSARVGNVLVALGLLAMLFAGAWQTGLVPGSRVVVPEPAALVRAREAAGGGSNIREVSAAPAATPTVPAATATPSGAPTANPAPTVEASSPPEPTAGITPSPSSEPVAGVASPEPSPPLPGARPVEHVGPMAAVPDLVDRVENTEQIKPGYATHLEIPSIQLETEVEQAGIKTNANGEPEWETLPFVAAHYGDLTALVGARGNAVISGHVVTLNEGNVFRNLNQLDLHDEIRVHTDTGDVHRFEVVTVKLVPPTEVSVLDPTADVTLTLITCGGEFDPVRREFSDRLIIVAKPLPAE